MASHPAGQPISPTDPGNWSGQEFPPESSQSSMGNVSPPSQTTPHAISNIGILKSFGGVQKHVTRDGQVPKRRGPKPDSKPAQTRRQELNRQAQRTHRERKEQYIKALEIEMSRLRERYADDTARMKNTLDQYRHTLAEQQNENVLLKEILASRGIDLQAEFESRKTAMMMAQPYSSSFAQSATGSNPSSYGQISPTVVSSSGRSPQSGKTHKYSNGALPYTPAMSTGGPSFHGHSPAEPGISERFIKDEPVTAVANMPGIFERDQQLGIDFILALEATCRDHGEYLIRRSVESPDTPEEAQYSGHALMACCPPPTHISTVPSQQGGLQPTYPHQVPDVSADTLTTLLNLSQQIAGEGHIEGGQVTPIMALQQLKAHPQYLSLTPDDVRMMTESVKKKVRCYGFGAVMEDFELRDALQAIFESKCDYLLEEYCSQEQLRADDL